MVSPGAPSQVQQDALKRAAIIIAIGVVVILLGVGVVLRQPVVAVVGAIAWVVAMVVSFRKDRPGGGRS